MTAFYNEIEPFAADWLEQLIDAGHIAPGVVDRRDIRDIEPRELDAYAQCHFFAGIGVWSYALRNAGWPDDRPVWTGSCPCQPFSSAGRGLGAADERHLWPHWFWLIEECNPAVIFGEQVASKDGLAWLDTVQTDLENAGYAVGTADICAAGVGAPHIRQRSWLCAERLADADGAGSQGWEVGRHGADQRIVRASSVGGGMADASSSKWRTEDHGRTIVRAETGERLESSDRSRQRGTDGGMANANSDGTNVEPRNTSEKARVSQEQRQPKNNTDVFERSGADSDGPGTVRSDGLPANDGVPGPTNGLWRNADWLFCRDGKWRPVESGTFPLANGSPYRMVSVCANCEAGGVRYEKLFVLRNFGSRDQGRSEEEILRQRLLHASQAGSTGHEQEYRPLPGAEANAGEDMQQVRKHDICPGTPQGPEPEERRPAQPRGVVQGMSLERAYDGASDVDVRGMQNGLFSCVTQEPEQNLFCPMCSRVGPHQCREEVVPRVGQLRGYGNAINAAVAQTFIEASMDAMTWRKLADD